MPPPDFEAARVACKSPAGRAAARWALDSDLSPIHVDCTTAVMLKILDGKCKMDREEKQVMVIIYDAVKHRPGALFAEGVHRLIENARHADQEYDFTDAVYEQRVLAETMISRPVMKAYKAMLREQGVIA